MSGAALAAALAAFRGAPGPALAPRAPGVGLAVAVIAAAMTFLAALALALGLGAGRLAADWSGAGAEAATLYVAASEPDAVEAQARAALDVLRTAPGVRSVRLVEVEEQRALLAPWLGADISLDALPLPLVIEIEADRAALDRPALEARLAAEAPGAVFDDHAAWRAPLVEAGRRLQLAAGAILAALGLVLAAALALAAGAAVAAGAGTVETLRLVGARDGFIAGAFVRPLLRRAALAAGLGALLAAALLLLLPSRAETQALAFSPRPEGWGWLSLAAPPLAAVAVAWAAAGLAARGALRRWS